MNNQKKNLWMMAERCFQQQKIRVLVTTLGISILLSACGGGGGGGASPNLPGIVATPATILLAENTSTSFDVVLNTEPTADVTIAVSSTDIGEAITDMNSLFFTDAAGTAPWNTPQTVTVVGVLDYQPDGNQNINIVLAAPASDDTGYSALAAINVAATVSDIDTTGFTVSKTALTTSESGTTDSYIVVLNTIPDGTVVIDVSSTDLSESTVSPASLTFDSGNWQTAQAITVIPVDDDIVDGNQTYNIDMAVNVSSTDTTGYAALTLASVVVTNADDDAAGFTVSETALSTTEGGYANQYSVVLNTQPDGTVVIDLSSTDLSEGTVTPASLTFGLGNWQAPQLVSVFPVDDDVVDGNQSYNIDMVVNTGSTDTTGYAALSLTSVAVTNTDDDAVGFTVSKTTLSTSEDGTTDSYTVVLNTVPDGTVVIDLISTNVGEGTIAPASLTFDSGNWQTAQTVTVTPVDDDVADGNQSYSINMAVNAGSTDTTGYAVQTLASVAVTNADNDTIGFTVSKTALSTSEDGTADSYTVVLNTVPNGTVVIDPSSADISEGTISPASLIFDDTNWQTAQTVIVTPLDDDLDDGNQVYNIDMTVNVGSTDTTGYAALTLAPVEVTNADNDAIGFTFSKTALSTNEDGTTDSYTVVLNTVPNGTVVLDMVISGDLTEGTLSTASLTFDDTNWQTAQTVTVTPLDDDVADGNKPYYIAMTINVSSTDTTGYAALTLSSINVVNGNDDIVGFTVTPATLTTSEDGTLTGSFDVVLISAPDGTVVLDVTNGDITEGTLSATALTFNSNTWNTPQTVDVTPVDDTLLDGDVAYLITTSVDTVGTLDGTGYDALPSQDISVINNDDETGEGTSLVRVALVFGKTLPYSGAVGGTGNSYYELTGLTIGANYTIGFTAITDNVDILVYETVKLGIFFCNLTNTGTADQICSFTATESSVYINVFGDATTNGATYTLDASSP